MLLTVPDFLTRVADQQKARDNAKKLYRDQLAPDFGTFDFIRPDEMRLSEIIAWLLDPLGTHAQGSLFLKLFCGHFVLDWTDVDSENASVRIEVPLPTGRRLDVLVQTKSDRKAVILENKPWAGDGKNQIRDYIAWAREAQASYLLIYLSSDGSGPREDSISEAELEREKADKTCQAIGYGELLPWLADCRKECRADRVITFIRDFEKYIEKTFKGVSDVTETREIARQIASSADMIRPAFSVLAAEEDVKGFLLEKLCDEIAEVVGNEFKNVDVQRSLTARNKYCYIGICLNEESRFCFSLEWQGTHFDWLIWGLARHDRQANAGEHTKKFTDLFGEGRQSEDWAWYRVASANDAILPLARDWRHNPQPWQAIANGELGKCIGQVILEFKRKIADPSIF
jgi:hypothetical protein